MYKCINMYVYIYKRIDISFIGCGVIVMLRDMVEEDQSCKANAALQMRDETRQPLVHLLAYCIY